MGLGALYADMEKKALDDACAYIVTLQNKVIELYFFGGIIVRLKSIQLPIDQMLDTLIKGDVREAVIRDMPIRPIDADPVSIVKTLSSSAYSSLRLPPKPSHSRLAKQVLLLQHLATGESKEHDEAIGLIAKEISHAQPTFSLDYEILRGRGAKLEKELGVLPRLAHPPTPAGSAKGTIRWAFEAYSISGAPQIQELVTVMLFLGEMPSNVISTTVDKSSGLGAKPGAARLSKTVYPTLANNSMAAIFKGTAHLGDMKVEWFSDKKGALFLTKTDLDLLGLQGGDKVIMILRK